MKGIVFSLFFDIIEQRFGMDTLETMLERAGLTHPFTSVGDYKHHELIAMIQAMHQLTGESVDNLQREVGKAMFSSLYQTLPIPIQHDLPFVEFLKKVEDEIHAEVKKLYPNARPPKFIFIEQSGEATVFEYQSHRCLSSLCLGLLEGCAAYFSQPITITSHYLKPDGSAVRFTIIKSES
ncbi:guanylate cyclase [Vibrio anguillarum]|uniref:Guanylate cyclase n=3 Tax=Vibrio anguillarum TaxID=55601 RepID=A0ABR9Z3Y3_VIBAN|nr:heme NO-binding domain-containing protein [Vibrio anguillarum]MBF4244346.1 guanylate cyclase [Vibrio anguillarum]MBF4372816.1 guanylate cyclase [Vibrio anguillarum]